MSVQDCGSSLIDLLSVFLRLSLISVIASEKERVFPFLMSLIINVLLINKKLSVEPLALMNKQQKQFSGKEINLGNLKFINRFRIRLFIRELRSNVTIVAGVFISLLLVMLALTIYSATTTIIDEIDRDVHFEYMYYLTYPEDDAPQNAEMAYHKTLTRERLGYNFDVSILGIDNDSIAFPSLKTLY